MIYWIELAILGCTSLFHAIASYREDQQAPPGQFVDLGGYCLHYCFMNQPQSHSPTIVIDHSLGGMEGYLLAEKLQHLAPVFFYDRAGYGWSDRSAKPRTSDEIVQELDQLLTQATIPTPYLLLGNSFGSYNLRLYAQRFPDKVAGLILTDGLHETAMLAMPLPLKLLKWFFVSGFIVCVMGAQLGIIRLLRSLGFFEGLKPELRQFSRGNVRSIQRSFCRATHWMTMIRELVGLDQSGQQLQATDHFGDLPIISIKSQSFFLPAWWTRLIPLNQANRLRDRIHLQLLQLSHQTTLLPAPQSGHFVWTDQPEVMIDAVQKMLHQIKGDRG
ncbi:MAG: alpha/beta hydrolase [Synechococcales bacterium]|nr:alpha/beta hydrolase [Synechococcales bacterium]